MNLFSHLFPATKNLATSPVRLSLERLEGRDLPSASTLDPVMRIAQTEFVQDNNQLSRSDVINLFDVVDGTEKAVFTAGKVSFKKVQYPDLTTPLSDQKLADLQSVVQNSTEWGMPADVANLAGKVVGYNLANEHYQGMSLLATGELAAGDPRSDLRDLVAKWFYGADLPAIGVGGATYKKANGSLFGSNGPQASDVAQGDAADCYFLSSLAETAQQAPQTIKSMFINNGDGTYTVRFFNSGVADYVTVNSMLPANWKNEFVYANNDYHGHSTNITSSDNVLWVAEAEKAYAQLAEEGWSGRNPVNAYVSLNIGDNRLASEQITSSTDAKWFKVQGSDTVQATASFQALLADFEKGDVLTVCTKTTVHGSTGLGDNHVYFVSGFDVKNQTITLTNPYWYRGKKTVTLNMAELAGNCHDVAVVVP